MPRSWTDIFLTSYVRAYCIKLFWRKNSNLGSNYPKNSNFWHFEISPIDQKITPSWLQIRLSRKIGRIGRLQIIDAKLNFQSIGASFRSVRIRVLPLERSKVRILPKNSIFFQIFWPLSRFCTQKTWSYVKSESISILALWTGFPNI